MSMFDELLHHKFLTLLDVDTLLQRLHLNTIQIVNRSIVVRDNLLIVVENLLDTS
jgi:hypothetical protein